MDLQSLELGLVLPNSASSCGEKKESLNRLLVQLCLRTPSVANLLVLFYVHGYPSKSDSSNDFQVGCSGSINVNDDSGSNNVVYFNGPGSRLLLFQVGGLVVAICEVFCLIIYGFVGLLLSFLVNC